ncbi:MAG: ABC transporter ATP-binding protein [Candidatus Abyssubacteria bacterium]
MNDLIRAEGLTKAFKTGATQLEVLKGIDLVIRGGEMVAIHGPSGVGKSTLLQILGTLDRPTSGRVWYGDIDIGRLGDRQIAKLRNERIGFIFQFYHLLPEFSALENVLLPAMLNGRQIRDARQRSERLLASVGLSGRETHKPDALSGGEQQRVAIARALVNKPEVVFADEPTGNLDEKTSGEIYKLIKQLNEEYGTTFVIVTHEQTLARGAGRLIKMVDGRVEE